MTYVIAIVGIVVALAGIRIVRGFRNVHVCARIGRVDRLRRLLDRDPALVGAKRHDGETPGHQAAKYGEMDALQLLVKRGGDVNARTNAGAAPLHLAAYYGELEAVRFLLANGAECDPKDEHGVTPLIAAMTENHTEIVDVLTKAGADPDAVPMVTDLGGGQFVIAIDHDDPLMPNARDRAHDTLPTLRELFTQHPHGTMVKFSFATDSGSTEHVWGELLALDETTFQARIKTQPMSHSKGVGEPQQRRLDELEDWQVELRDGRYRGGYGYQVMFQRMRERLGKLPESIAAEAERFVDHGTPPT